MPATTIQKQLSQQPQGAQIPKNTPRRKSWMKIVTTPGEERVVPPLGKGVEAKLTGLLPELFNLWGGPAGGKNKNCCSFLQCLEAADPEVAKQDSSPYDDDDIDDGWSSSEDPEEVIPNSETAVTANKPRSPSKTRVGKRGRPRKRLIALHRNNPESLNKWGIVSHRPYSQQRLGANPVLHR